MKKITKLLATLLVAASSASASVTISGTSIVSTEIFGDTIGVYVASTSSTFDVSKFTGDDKIAANTSFAAGGDLLGYTILGTATIGPAGGMGALVSGVTYNLSANVATGNEIGILVFENSSTETIALDPYTIWANGYTVPADGANLSWTGTGAPYMGASAGSFSFLTVPEPSSAALLAGLLALGSVMLRRRTA